MRGGLVHSCVFAYRVQYLLPLAALPLGLLVPFRPTLHANVSWGKFHPITNSDFSPPHWPSGTMIHGYLVRRMQNTRVLLLLLAFFHISRDQPSTAAPSGAFGRREFFLGGTCTRAEHVNRGFEL